MTISVLLVDDHQLMREGLRAVLSRDSTITVIAEADTGWRALELVREMPPDIVVMDISMPDLNGIDATRRLHDKHPETKVIGLSTHTDKRYILAMLEAGALGYVVKAAAGDDLIRAIHAVARGDKYISPEVTGVLINSHLNRTPSPEEMGGTALGAREREVLQLLAEGKTSAEIAAILHISTSTVETHRRNIMQKLDLHSVAELTKYAIREGLTSLDP
jgi:two-component system NarL family response regulator